MNLLSSPRSDFFGRKFRPRSIAGLTLIELLIVLVIIAGVGGVLVSTFGDLSVTGPDDVKRSPEEIATLSTMQTVREALVGSSVNEPGYLQDVGEFPSTLGGLFSPEASVIANGLEEYDPATKRGWRGPYMLDNSIVYGDFAHYDEAPIGYDGFPAYPATDPSILDGWAKPLVLGQGPDPVDASLTHDWLISAGPNQILETDLSDPIDPDPNDDDDIVIFLRTTDPNL